MIWWRWDDEDGCWRPTLVPPAGSFHVNGAARLLPLRGRRVALLTREPATVNGLPCLPLEILGDRDEVRIAGERFCFSIRSSGEVTPFATRTREIRCRRCLGRLAEGDPVVRCPVCDAHHHQTCWTYDTRCQACGHPTTEVSWVPDSLN